MRNAAEHCWGFNVSSNDFGRFCIKLKILLNLNKRVSFQLKMSKRKKLGENIQKALEKWEKIRFGGKVEVLGSLSTMGFPISGEATHRGVQFLL